MRIVDDIEQQIQKSEILAILILAMQSIGESRMTAHNRTVIKGHVRVSYNVVLKISSSFAASSSSFWGFCLASFARLRSFHLTDGYSLRYSNS